MENRNYIKRILYFYYLVNIAFQISSGYDIQSFDDTVLFKINWPGKTSTDLLESQKNVEPYLITTANNEKYQCYIPDTTIQENVKEITYNGPNALEILMTLFDQNTCSYRLESYWTYELCHGKYLKQYHEERDGKKVNIQQYKLGVIGVPQLKALASEYEVHAKNPNRKQEIPVKKIDGISMPYLEVEMKDGTMCDLNDKPRSTKVLYVCYENGKQDIYSLKETSSCEYEAVVLTPVLCNHPDYKPLDTGENEINCKPIDNAPKKPRSLKAMQMESLKLRHQKLLDEKPQKVYAIFRIDKDGQDGQPQVRVEIHPVDPLDKYSLASAGQHLHFSKETNLPKNDLVYGFLNGKNCLSGGHGWWKYEFCYGRSVSQYHIEANDAKSVLSLGVFDKEKHIEWINANPHKKPKPLAQRKQVSHFYSDGTYCESIKKPRQTEVKLKCVNNPSTSPSSVSLYLIEFTMCEYILGVESPIICDLLQYADDDYGIISDKALVNFDRLKVSKINIDDGNDRIANEDE